MSNVTVKLALRRAAVVALTIAMLGVGLVSVRVAADWRAAEAPLDTVPVSAGSVEDAVQAQDDRAVELEDRIRQLTVELDGLQSAVGAAGEAVEGGTGDAETLQGQLDGARERLRTMQRQLKTAQARLVELRRAAARQAAINANAASGVQAAQPAREDDHESEEHDDD